MYVFVYVCTNVLLRYTILIYITVCYIYSDSYTELLFIFPLLWSMFLCVRLACLLTRLPHSSSPSMLLWPWRFLPLGVIDCRA